MSDKPDAKNARGLARELEKEVRVLNAVVERNYTADEPWHNAEEELRGRVDRLPLCVEKVVTYRVTLGTGGPAMGVDWHPNGNAQVWWQDWFTEKVYADLDSDVADTLAQTWAVGEYDEGFHDE